MSSCEFFIFEGLAVGWFVWLNFPEGEGSYFEGIGCVGGVNSLFPWSLFVRLFWFFLCFFGFCFFDFFYALI